VDLNELFWPEPKHTNIENINLLDGDQIDNATPDVSFNSELIHGK